MRSLYSLFFCVLFQGLDSHAQVLGVIGSSTAAGGGATTFDSSWVGRTQLYFRNLGQLTNYHDIAVSGSTTWAGMPSSFTPPVGNPQPPSPDPTANVTRILQLNSDVVVIAYPTNDIVNGFTLTQYLSNLRTIYDSVVKTGKTAWVTTTQPRDDIPLSMRQTLLVGRDSILNEFNGRALNFWDPVTDPSTLGILAQYSAGDDIHLNNAGHAVIAQVAENANIMTPAPLALTLTGFTARLTGSKVLLEWTASNDNNGTPIRFDIQRSTDGNTFTSLYQTATTSNTNNDSWSWTDNYCPHGLSFYRLKGLQGTTNLYSKSIPINRPATSLSIGKLYLSSQSRLISDIEIPSPGDLSISIVNLSGIPVFQNRFSNLPPSGSITISLPPLAAGEYVLKACTPDGQTAVKPFVKL